VGAARASSGMGRANRYAKTDCRIEFAVGRVSFPTRDPDEQYGVRLISRPRYGYAEPRYAGPGWDWRQSIPRGDPCIRRDRGD